MSNIKEIESVEDLKEKIGLDLFKVTPPDVEHYYHVVNAFQKKYLSSHSVYKLNEDSSLNIINNNLEQINNYLKFAIEVYNRGILITVLSTDIELRERKKNITEILRYLISEMKNDTEYLLTLKNRINLTDQLIIMADQLKWAKYAFVFSALAIFISILSLLIAFFR